MRLIRAFAPILAISLLLAQLADGQEPVPMKPAAPAAQPTPPAAQPAADPNLQFLDQVLRTATAVQSLVKSMNLDKAISAQTSYPPGDPRSLQRAAEFIGVGAGVGMALGEMAHSQRGAITGAAIGGAAGVIVDQILRRQAAKMQAFPPDSNPSTSPRPDR
ncbi:MAG TPA: hypothetical protein VIY49_09155 [Bryobacteraceae bacterium]